MQTNPRDTKLSKFIVLSLLISLTCGALLSCKSESEKEKTFTIGVINPSVIMGPVLDGFKAGMLELGYKEGETLTYIYEGAVSKDELDRVAQDLLAQDVDLVLALTTPAALVMQRLTVESKTPIVFAPVTDPVGAGLVASLRQPGANLTGIATGGSETKRLEWLLRLSPDVQRIYLPYNSGDQSPISALELMQPLAAEKGVELVLRQATNADEVKAAIENIPDDVDAIFIGPDSFVGSFFADWVTASIARKLPLTGSSVSHVEAGMLFSYSFDTFATGKQAAHLADRILQGTNPSDLPVETSEFFLSVNLKTAEAIGLDISDEILSQAHEIFR